MVKIGIIGTGYWGKHHLRTFSQSKCEVVGICDLDPQKRELADSYGVKYYSEYKKLLKKVDAISIVTSPVSHFVIAKKALKQGKHVLVEKPFVLRIKEGRELIELARANNCILMVGHIYLFHPAITELKKIIKQKELGKIYYLISDRLNLGIVRSDVNSLWNFAPHDLSILLYLLDQKPTSVSVIGQSYLQKGIEDITLVNLRYPNNTLAHLTLSWLHPNKVRELTVVGSQKMAVFDDVNLQAPLKIYDKGVEPEKTESQKQWQTFGEFKMKVRFGDVVTPTLPTTEPLQEEVNHFLTCIKTGIKPVSDATMGLDVLSILVAADKSLKKGGKEIEIRYK